MSRSPLIQPRVASFDSNGSIKKDWGPLSKKHDIDFFEMVKIIKGSTSETDIAVKKSNLYVVFHTSKGDMHYRNLRENGKPTGTAKKAFKVKKDRFGGMDTATFQDEALVVFVEYNKKGTASIIRFANFKIK